MTCPFSSPCSPYDNTVGDFEEIYGGESDPNEPQAGLWDAVMTCFFIDTVSGILFYQHNYCSLSFCWTVLSTRFTAFAHYFAFDYMRRLVMCYFQAKNIVNYLRIVHKILAPGGVWINLGKSYNEREPDGL